MYFACFYQTMFVGDKSGTVNKFKKLLHMLNAAESDMQGEVSNFRGIAF